MRRVLGLGLALSLLLVPQVGVGQTVDELFDQVLTELRQGRYEEAERTWRRLLQIEPNNAGAYVGLGLALERQGKLDEAVAAYERAIDLNPDYAGAYVGIGLALSDQGKLDEAVAAYERAIDFNPDDAIAHYNLGNALYNQGKLDEAVAAFQRAIDLNPEDAIAHYNLGVALSDQGKLDEAVAAFQRAIDLNPEFAIAHYNLGVALYNQGKLDEAVAAFQRAIDLNPELAEAYNGLGIALRQQGKLDEAVAAYERAIDLNPEYATAYNGLGNALSDQGKLDEAVAAFQRAIDLNPEHTIAHYNLGLALRQQGKLDEAVAAYRTALRLPDEQGTPASAHTLAHNNLGYALQQQGNLEDAISQYQTAIQLDPEYAQARTNLREAQRLLALRDNPLPDDREERFPSLEENPYFPLQRSIVLIIAETQSGSNQGTGWVIEREGNRTLIVTNRHVVSDNNTRRPSDSIEIELYSQNDPEHRLRFPARIHKITDPNDPLDLAILEVNDLPDDLEPLSLSNSRAPLGANISVIGHPVTGNPWSWQPGHISAITAAPDQQNLQLAVPNLAVGNSGSPIFYDNQVIGMVTSISNRQTATSSGTEGDFTGGFGFAYPLDILQNQLQDWGIRF